VQNGKPAVLALLIQCLSLGIVTVCLTFAWHSLHVRLSLIQAVCCQAALTLLLTRWCNLAWWWCLIGPLFPFALILMLMLPVPHWLYLALFLFFLAFYWSTYRTQVPYFPSTRHAWQALEQLLPPDRPIALVDIGSGLGGLIMYLGKKYPASQFYGVEIAPLPWFLSFARNLLRKPGEAVNTRFIRASYETLNFAEFDVVFAYLSPAAMPALWAKARQEMRPGSMLVSYEFPVVGVGEHLSIYPDNNPEFGRKLFVWYL